jgi:hypothetical protein
MQERAKEAPNRFEAALMFQYMASIDAPQAIAQAAATTAMKPENVMRRFNTAYVGGKITKTLPVWTSLLRG